MEIRKEMSSLREREREYKGKEREIYTKSLAGAAGDGNGDGSAAAVEAEEEVVEGAEEPPEMGEEEAGNEVLRDIYQTGGGGEGRLVAAKEEAMRMAASAWGVQPPGSEKDGGAKSKMESNVERMLAMLDKEEEEQVLEGCEGGGGGSGALLVAWMVVRCRRCGGGRGDCGGGDD